MNNQRRNFRLTCALLAAVLAVGVAGCAQPAEDKQPQGKTQQLWIADNFVDPQEGYPMENPSAIELSATAALQKNSLLNGQTQKQQQSQEMKAVWLSYLDLKPMLLDKNDKSVGKAQFTQNIQKAFDNIQQLGLNTVIAQVRPFSDALYESELFPWSYLATGEEGADPGFDPACYHGRAGTPAWLAASCVGQSLPGAHLGDQQAVEQQKSCCQTAQKRRCHPLQRCSDL